MTGQELMYAVLFFASISGALWAVWWRIEGKVDRAKSEAVARADEAQRHVDGVSRDLAAYKLHVSETYSTKSGMKEIKDEILGAVSGIRDDVRHLATRIDTMHESSVKPRPTRRTAD